MKHMLAATVEAAPVEAAPDGDADSGEHGVECKAVSEQKYSETYGRWSRMYCRK